MDQPELGWTTPVKVVRVLDGDTVEVSVTKTFMVRLQDDDSDFDTPEIRKPASPEEIAKGKECKRHLEGLLFELASSREDVVLHIDADETGKFSKSLNFTRVKGHLFVDGKDVTDEMNKFMNRQGDYE
jgi:endonuclease YncB( thermonuclease family)